MKALDSLGFVIFSVGLSNGLITVDWASVRMVLSVSYWVNRSTNASAHLVSHSVWKLHVYYSVDIVFVQLVTGLFRSIIAC